MVCGGGGVVVSGGVVSGGHIHGTKANEHDLSEVHPVKLHLINSQ
jgi:hypothetical protein